LGEVIIRDRQNNGYPHLLAPIIPLIFKKNPVIKVMAIPYIIDIIIEILILLILFLRLI
jgi:hypothetical protein